MIFERCAFVVICVALSSLNPTSSEAAPSLDTADKRDKIILDRHTTIPRQSDFSQPAIALKREAKYNRRSPGSATESSLEENSLGKTGSKSIRPSDRYLALGAMVLTSGISFLLLWVLFKNPVQNERDLAKVAVVDLDSESTIQTDSQANLAVEDGIDSTIDLNSDDSAITNESSPNLTINIDIVRELIQDLQADTPICDSSTFNPHAQARRRKAIWKLAKIGDCRSIEPLLEIMSQVGEPDKSLIIQAVSQITNRSFKSINEQLFTDLQDLDPEVRLNAIKDFKNLYQFVTPVVTKIAQMQSDADYQVRQAATQALTQLNASPLPAFTKLKNSSEPVDLISGENSQANLHLVAYLLAELDAEKQC